MEKFPAWYYGPNGASNVFASEADVPAGWQDHPSKVKNDPTATPGEAGGEPRSTKSTAASPAGNPGNTEDGTLDADGWPWDEAMHAGTKAKTGAGLWRMKVGATRPAPKPGYPKPAKPLDL